MEIKFRVRVEQCPSCNKFMMQKASYGIFPHQCNEGQDYQMKENGIVYISRSEVDDKNICVECESSGKASFKCALCSEVKDSKKLNDSFGHMPAEYLCDDCYEVTPAKTWDIKVEHLQESHKYDWE